MSLPLRIHLHCLLIAGSSAVTIFHRRTISLLLKVSSLSTGPESDSRLECERDTKTGQDWQLVDAVEGGSVEIENILAAIYVGDTQVEFQYRAFAKGEFAFHTEVKAVVVR